MLHLCGCVCFSTNHHELLLPSAYEKDRAFVQRDKSDGLERYQIKTNETSLSAPSRYRS
jgi:hypothetical protein